MPFVRHSEVTSAGLTGGSLAMKLFHRSEPPIWAEMSVAAPKNRWNPSAVPGSERLLLVQRSVEMFLRTGSTLRVSGSMAFSPTTHSSLRQC